MRSCRFGRLWSRFFQFCSISVVLLLLLRCAGMTVPCSMSRRANESISGHAFSHKSVWFQSEEKPGNQWWPYWCFSLWFWMIFWNDSQWRSWLIFRTSLRGRKYCFLHKTSGHWWSHGDKTWLFSVMTTSSRRKIAHYRQPHISLRGAQLPRPGWLASHWSLFWVFLRLPMVWASLFPYQRGKANQASQTKPATYWSSEDSILFSWVWGVERWVGWG